VDFQVMRATHASIGHRLKLDPKVTAKAAIVSVWRSRSTQGPPLRIGAVAAKKLEESVLGKRKAVRIPRPKES
jgi:hypothetical protein